MTTFGFGGVSPQEVAAMQRRMNALADHAIATMARVCALEARESLRDQGRSPRMPVEFRSQFGEDAWIWQILGGQTTGFFIEVGAFDGFHYSVSYALEAMGWNGLLIEALPELHAKCAACRPHSRAVHAALSKPGAPETMEFKFVKDQYGGMLSYLDNTDKGPLAADHAKKIEQNKFATESVRVPVTTMNKLLDGHTGPIDAAVIDVEGAEIDLLEGFDLARWKPRVLILEDNSSDPNSPLGKYMADKPYVFTGWVGVNRTYVHKEHRALLENVRKY